jgi:hypothetical protein
MTTLSPEARTAVVDALRANHEQIIQDMAATVSSHVRSRQEHPSYGYTKTSIRKYLERMEGSIGTYMVLFGQANHAGAPILAQFTQTLTTVAVERARREVQAL